MLNNQSILNEILSSTLDPLVVTDQNGTILVASDSVEHVFGYSPAYLVGQNVSLFMPEPHQSKHDQYLEAYRNTGRTFVLGNTRVLQAKRRDGQLFPCEVTVWRTEGETSSGPLFTGILRDVSERVELEASVARSEERLRKIVLEMPVMMMACNSQGLVVYWNRECEKVTGYAATQMCGNNNAWRMLYPADEVCEEIRNYWTSPLPFRDREWQLQCIDGTSRTIAWSNVSAEVPIPGWCTWAIGVDITSRRQFERDLESARDIAQSALAAKSLFLAHISHEIRTPLTAILGFVELLMLNRHVQQLPEEQMSMLADVQRCGNHLLMVVSDILDQSKLEESRMTVEHIDCSPAEIAAEVVSSLRGYAAQKDLTLNLKLAAGLPDVIQTDPMRLRQILLNLIGNAVKFTERGHIDLCVNYTETQGAGGFRFDVIDTGIGIDEDQVARLFRPFVQADASMSRRYGGTGLGLSISRELTMLMGGTLTVESTVGKGSTFSLVLPVRRATTSAAVQFSDSVPGGVDGEATSMEPTLRGMHILVAEDGPDNQRLIKIILQKAGADVKLVENGLLAINEVLASENSDVPFDLVLMDMQMPEMDGYAATRNLRKHGYMRPIIALTAHEGDEARQACLAAGCNDYLSKPFDRKHLVRLLKRFYGANVSGSSRHETPLTLGIRGEATR